MLCEPGKSSVRLGNAYALKRYVSFSHFKVIRYRAEDTVGETGATEGTQTYNKTSALCISAKPTRRAIGGSATRGNRAPLRRPAIVADDVFWQETDPRFPASDLSSHSVKAGERSCFSVLSRSTDP